MEQKRGGIRKKIAILALLIFSVASYYFCSQTLFSFGKNSKRYESRSNGYIGRRKNVDRVVKLPSNYEKWFAVNVGDLKERRKLWLTISSSDNRNRTRRLPDIIGIGSKKCGTGTFQQFIGYHPMVKTASKEAHFFDAIGHYKKGLEYYKSLMQPATTKQLVAEKTPSYFRGPPFELPSIIIEDLPKVKLWQLMCDPVKRAYSDYVMRSIKFKRAIGEKSFDQYMDKYMTMVKKLFTEETVEYDGGKTWNNSLIEILTKEPDTYPFAHGLYAYYVKRWLKIFPREQYLIINGNEFLLDPGKIIEQVQDYLEIPKVILQRDFVKHPSTNLFCLRPWWNPRYNFWSEFKSEDSWENSLICPPPSKGRTRSAKSIYRLSDEQRRRLEMFFEPYNRILYRILGRNFHW